MLCVYMAFSIKNVHSEIVENQTLFVYHSDCAADDSSCILFHYIDGLTNFNEVQFTVDIIHTLMLIKNIHIPNYSFLT